MEEKLNMMLPIISIFKENMKYLEDGILNGIVSYIPLKFSFFYDNFIKGKENQDINIPIETGKEYYFINKILLNTKGFYPRNKNQEFLEVSLKQSLIDRKVYVTTSIGYKDSMNRDYNSWVVLEDNEEMPQYSSLYSYKEVENQENSLLELMAYHYKYAYDEIKDKFIKIPENLQRRNLMRNFVAKDCIKITGSDESRFADYGRLIAFLLSKVQLTDSEKDIFKDIINNIATQDTFKKIVDKEVKINNIVKRYKDGTYKETDNIGV